MARTLLIARVMANTDHISSLSAGFSSLGPKTEGAKIQPFSHHLEPVLPPNWGFSPTLGPVVCPQKSTELLSSAVGALPAGDLPHPDPGALINLDRALMQASVSGLCLQFQSAELMGVVAEIAQVQGVLRCRFRADGAVQRQGLERTRQEVLRRLEGISSTPVVCEVSS